MDKTKEKLKMNLVSSTATCINSFSLPKFFSPINVTVPSGIHSNRDYNYNKTTKVWRNGGNTTLQSV